VIYQHLGDSDWWNVDGDTGEVGQE
jgi:hypothetical protein